VSRPIGECGPELSQVRAACRGSFPPIERMIPITGRNPNFVPGGDPFSHQRISFRVPSRPVPMSGRRVLRPRLPVSRPLCLLVILLPLVKKDPHHQQIHFASPAGPAGDLSPPSNLFPRPVPPLSPSPVRFGREGAGLRRAPFGSEPQGRRQSSRVRADSLGLASIKQPVPSHGSCPVPSHWQGAAPTGPKSAQRAGDPFLLLKEGSPSPAGIQISSPAGILSPPANLFPPPVAWI
jgi:hypothetical protein